MTLLIYQTQANVGIAMGSGSDIASESADIVLMKSELTDVVSALDLSRTVFRRIKFNFTWALAYNVIAVPSTYLLNLRGSIDKMTHFLFLCLVAAGVLYPLTQAPLPAGIAAALEASSTLVVVLAALLLRSWRPPKIGLAKPDPRATYSLKNINYIDGNGSEEEQEVHVNLV